MQSNTDRRAQGLREKIPDIQKTLDMVRFLKGRKVMIMCGPQGHRSESEIRETYTRLARFGAARDDF